MLSPATQHRALVRRVSGSLSDVERFQAWQLDSLEARSDDSEVLSFGPFRAVFFTMDEPPPTAWVMLVDARATQADTLKALTKLRAACKKRKVALEIEYNEAVFPAVGAWLETAGLKLAEKNPLMAIRPDAFKPFANPDVTMTKLTPAAAQAELEAFQRLRWTNGGEIKRTVPSVERLVEELGRPGSVHLLAWIDWEAAGTGVSHAVKGAGEIVGVVTGVKNRRRGVAATVTSELVRRHFDTGGDFVFLDAANEAAAAVYKRLGFSRFGANLIYR